MYLIFKFTNTEIYNEIISELYLYYNSTMVSSLIIYNGTIYDKNEYINNSMKFHPDVIYDINYQNILIDIAKANYLDKNTYKGFFFGYIKYDNTISIKDNFEKSIMNIEYFTDGSSLNKVNIRKYLRDINNKHLFRSNFIDLIIGEGINNPDNLHIPIIE